MGSSIQEKQAEAVREALGEVGVAFDNLNHAARILSERVEFPGKAELVASMAAFRVASDKAFQAPALESFKASVSPLKLPAPKPELFGGWVPRGRPSIAEVLDLDKHGGL